MIIVLAILVGLLLPVIAAALRTAKNAAVQAEISQLAQALASFKAAYGDYPPSRVILYENGFFPVGNTQHVNGDSNDITYGALAQRSLIALRKFFPKVVFSTSGQPPTVFYNPPPGNGFWYDFNGNGVMDGPYILQGDECLVFFLGGIPFQDPTTGAFGMTGFGKDPVNPVHEQPGLRRAIQRQLEPDVQRQPAAAGIRVQCGPVVPRPQQPGASQHGGERDSAEYSRVLRQPGQLAAGGCEHDAELLRVLQRLRQRSLRRQRREFPERAGRQQQWPDRADFPARRESVPVALTEPVHRDVHGE